MLDLYEQKIIIGYNQNILKANLREDIVASFCEEMEGMLTGLGVAPKISNNFDNQLREYRHSDSCGKDCDITIEKLTGYLQDTLATRAAELQNCPPDNLQLSINELAEDLSLTAAEKNVLNFMIRYNLSIYQRIFDAITGDEISPLELLSIVMDIPKMELSELLGPNGHLIKTGLITCENDSHLSHIRPTWGNNRASDLSDIYYMPKMVLKAFSKCVNQAVNIRNAILGNPLSATLEWEDFDHLGNTKDKLATFIKEAVSRKMTGVNIMLWGAPGTGKTQFCRTLAKQLGLSLFAVGEADEDGDEPARSDRIDSFKLTQQLLKNLTSNNLILFDEMDDVFGSGSNSLAALFDIPTGNNGSKVFLNRMLEENPVPTIWIVNNPRCLDESTIRRMALAIEIKNPPAKARAAVWQRLLNKYQLSISEDEVNKLAASEVSPAIADSAARFASLVGSGSEDFRFATEGLIRASKGHLQPRSKISAIPYLPDLITADNNLEKLADNIKDSTARDFSLCLYGPPGTGKSAFIRYLAELLDMPVLFKRASDIFDKYVGNTEKQIASAFEEAIDTNSFLVFDEADSLLADRRNAHTSWEISQVNEMLTWMECHPLPFACTTNLKEHLDQAAMRRFTFKCKFDYLAPAQLQAAFKHFFNLNLLPNQARELQFLTPGDFSVVHNKARFLGRSPQIADYLELLQQEAANKNENCTRQVGFFN